MSVAFQDSSASTRRSADSPYKQLVRQQMNTSLTFLGNFSDSISFDPNSTLSGKIGDIYVPNSIMSRALTKGLREYRSMTSERSASTSVPKSRLVQHPLKKKEYMIEQDDPLEKGFEREISKTKIMEIYDPRENYETKWSKMVEARNMAKAFENFNRSRHKTKAVIFDNISMNRKNVKRRLAAIKDNSANAEILNQKTLNTTRKQELEENLRELKAEEIKKRINYAREAKETMAKSIDIAKSILEQEKKQRHDLKHPKTVNLREFTSSKVFIHFK